MDTLLRPQDCSRDHIPVFLRAPGVSLVSVSCTRPAASEIAHAGHDRADARDDRSPFGEHRVREVEHDDYRCPHQGGKPVFGRRVAAREQQVIAAAEIQAHRRVSPDRPATLVIGKCIPDQ